jgi:hypothetical protein
MIGQRTRDRDTLRFAPDSFAGKALLRRPTGARDEFHLAAIVRTSRWPCASSGRHHSPPRVSCVASIGA